MSYQSLGAEAAGTPALLEGHDCRAGTAAHGCA